MSIKRNTDAQIALASTILVLQRAQPNPTKKLPHLAGLFPLWMKTVKIKIRGKSICIYPYTFLSLLKRQES